MNIMKNINFKTLWALWTLWMLWKYDFFLLLADPGKARGCFINSLVINWLITYSVSLFLPHLYGAATPKQLEIALPVIKLPRCYSDQELSKPQRASKSHQWFKSYGHFTEAVDVANWLSFIGKGLRLQPAHQACFYSWWILWEWTLWTLCILWISWILWTLRLLCTLWTFWICEHYKNYDHYEHY